MVHTLCYIVVNAEYVYFLIANIATECSDKYETVIKIDEKLLVTS